jgi:glycosyltransferase involved in cell wall biosynthesis
MSVFIPVSAIIPTRNRAESLRRTLRSLFSQSAQPSEVVIVDGSEDDATKMLVADFANQISGVSLRRSEAIKRGAASQRNQGVAQSVQPFVLFCDDDVLFEPDCIERQWKAINANQDLGGVSAMITNQKYHPPGFASRIIFGFLNGSSDKTFAGRVLGPAVHLLPEDRDDLPEVVPVEWMNLGCTMYRRTALPSPPFDLFFTDYSMMEDLTLSLRVGRNWKLANARTARIFHDSQPGGHKSDLRVLTKMEIMNRRYVVRNILGQRGLLTLLRLGVWQLFQVASVAARASTRGNTVPILLGQADAVKAIILREKQR